jgi:hypothetical protein
MYEVVHTHTHVYIHTRTHTHTHTQNAPKQVPRSLCATITDMAASLDSMKGPVVCVPLGIVSRLENA